MKRWRNLAGLFLLIAATFAAGYYSARMTSAAEFASYPSVEVVDEVEYLDVTLQDDVALQSNELKPEMITLPKFYTYDKEPQIGDQYTVPVN